MVVFTVAVVLAGCGSDAPSDVSDAQRLAVDVPVTILTGELATLSARLIARDGRAMPASAVTYSVDDTTVAEVTAAGVVRARRPGITVVRGAAGALRATGALHVVPRLRALDVRVGPRTLAIGDSVRVSAPGIDSSGATVTSFARLSVEPADAAVVRDGWLVSRAAQLAVVTARAGTMQSVDTVVMQGPSAFGLAMIPLRGSAPSPRWLASLARVQTVLRRVVRIAPLGGRVRVPVDGCGNRTVLEEDVAGLTVLVRFGELPGPLVGLSGPCVLRENSGLPLLGLVEIDTLKLGIASDTVVDRLILHETLHVMGVGALWAQAAYGGHVVGGPEDVDPIYVGPAALRGWARIRGSATAAVRAIPLQIGSRDHWRVDPLFDEVMAPRLRTTPQVLSAITVGALRDIGWEVEPEAYDDLVLTPTPSARTAGPGMVTRCAACDQPLVERVRPPAYIRRRDGRLVRRDVSIHAPAHLP
jgi:hypothetical protein